MVECMVQWKGLFLKLLDTGLSILILWRSALFQFRCFPVAGPGDAMRLLTRNWTHQCMRLFMQVGRPARACACTGGFAPSARASAAAARRCAAGEGVWRRTRCSRACPRVPPMPGQAPRGT